MGNRPFACPRRQHLRGQGQLLVRAGLTAPDVAPPSARAPGRPSRAQGRDRGRGRLRFVILLDTNVLSALMRTSPEPAVVAWLDRQPADSVWITSITVVRPLSATNSVQTSTDRRLVTEQLMPASPDDDC